MADREQLEALDVDSFRLQLIMPDCASAATASAPAPLEFGTNGLSAAAYMFDPCGRSSWHDVSLQAKGTSAFNFVVEIPFGTLQKQEVALNKAYNFIEDNAGATKKLEAFGKPPPFNYGILPQTYCHPEEMKECGVGGDEAPLDVLELSGEKLTVGHIYEIQILGAFCVVDKSELDWKVFTMRSEALADLAARYGPLLLAPKLREELTQVMQWWSDWYDFKNKASGKVTKFPYGKRIVPAAAALSRVYVAHKGWLRLCKQPGQLWLSNPAKRQGDSPSETSKRARTNTA